MGREKIPGFCGKSRDLRHFTQSFPRTPLSHLKGQTFAVKNGCSGILTLRVRIKYGRN